MKSRCPEALTSAFQPNVPPPTFQPMGREYQGENQCVTSAVKRGGGAVTLFQRVILKEALGGLIQSDIQRNISVTVHSRQRRSSLQEEPEETSRTATKSSG